MIWGKFWKLFKIPPKIALTKALDKIQDKLFSSDEVDFTRKYFFENYKNQVTSLNTGYFAFPDEEFLSKKSELLRYLAQNFLQHKFNLLGTGWISRNHTITKDEIIAHLPIFWQKEATDLYSKINDANYKPINFWNDPKQDYQWNPRFYKNIPIMFGADIKHPWELGRMQHLPILAYCYHYFKNKDAEISQKCFSEFVNEILDFVASNPVGYSVQWSSSMDVSIRLTNWLVAYDLFVNSGCTFEQWFLSTFFESIYKHILFVIDNLEWSGGLRGNHYFANVVSMVFAGAYLLSDEFSAKILAFGINELIDETLYQFYQDGGNFESSTYYHIQTTEMLLLSIYLLFSLRKEKLSFLDEFTKNHKRIYFVKRRTGRLNFKIDLLGSTLIFPNEFLQRLYKIIKFTKCIQKTTGEFEQIGDNDSGYFLRLDYFFENLEIKKELFPNVLKRYMLRELINSLSKDIDQRMNLFKVQTAKRFYLPANEVNVYPKLYSFKQFGLYVVKAADYSLFVRCGSIGQKGKGGHSHNDQLSLTLDLRGNDIFVDPGLYCYTCSENERNKYRSSHFHNTLCIENIEQNIWKTGTPEELFWIFKEKTKAKLLSISDNSIELVHYAYAKPHIRKIYFTPQSISICDTLELDCEKLLYFHLHPNVEIICLDNGLHLVNENSKVSIFVEDCNLEIGNYEYCPQYGLKLHSKKLIFRTIKRRIITKIEIL